MVGGIENRGESMPKTRKSHPPSLKAKVAVEAIKAHKTAAQIAQMFGVHPTQVGGWKKQALAGLPDIFGNGREQMRQQALRVSGSIESAIIMSGIGRSTYYRLRGKVRESGGNEQQRRFFQAVHKAESQIKMMREHQLSKHFEKDWRAIAWWLERKCPNEYGRRRPAPLPDPGTGEAE